MNQVASKSGKEAELSAELEAMIHEVEAFGAPPADTGETCSLA